MAPYHPFGGSTFTPDTTPYHPSFNDSTYDDRPKYEEVILSLTERLRERESEVRLLREENSELQNQLRLRGKPINLDAAYEDLLAHLKQREANFYSESMKREERQQNLEKEICKLKDKAHASRKLLDEQEMHISLIEKDGDDQLERILSIKKKADSELTKMQNQLDAAMSDNKEKHLRIIKLKDEVHSLLIETDHGKQREIEDRETLAQLLERVNNHTRDQYDLERINEDLQSRLEMQRRLLREKEDEILNVERSRDERENLLKDDLERMSNRLNEIIETKRKTSQDQQEIIHLLYQQIDRYQAIIDEADYVSHEQRSALLASKKKIELLSTAIERVQSSGFLSRLDKLFLCGSKSNDSTFNSLLDSAR